ncbi:MAG: DNA repair protein RecO [Treponema sp.]|nr:DNA repair protein RecO [Treponema sp.]
MNRSICIQALVLNLKVMGENNTSVTLLTPEKGIVYATLYGGPKSKLKSLVSLYNSGKMWLYENPEKNQIKITDFEVQNYHSSFTSNLFKIYAANLVAELAIKSHCNGANEEFFKYCSGFYDGMDLSTEEQSRVGLLRFLWRFILMSGVQPSTENCEHCGISFFDQKFENNAISYYNIIENCFICSDCVNDFTGLFPVNISALHYLDGVTNLPPAQVRMLKITKDDYEQLRQLLFFLVEKILETKLNTLETGIGIL